MIFGRPLSFGPIVQLAEQSAHNRSVLGSIPSGATICRCGGMADTADLKSAELVRTGSNPVTGTIIFYGKEKAVSHVVKNSAI